MPVMRYREALNQALREEMEADENVFLMGEDIGVFQGAFKVTAGLLEEFGEKRVRDTPISENTIVGMGVGAAMIGLRPVVELMTINFSLLAMDQIVNHAAAIHYMFGGQVKVPMVIRMPQGAGHQLGPTHSHSWEAYYLHVPGLLVAVPSTPEDAKGLLKTAIRDDNPVVFIEHETLYGQRGEVPENGGPMRFGEAAIRREGDDVTIIGISRMAVTAGEGGREARGRARHRRRADRPAHAPPARPRHDPRVGQEDQPGRDRRGGLAARRRGREPRGADPGAGIRLARRPRAARHRRGCADALLQATRAGGVPARGARRAGRARHLPGPVRRSMASDVTMPRLSDSMEEGTVLKWLVEEGAEVTRGEPLVEIETDKANMTYDADTDGVLVEIVAQEGDTLAIGEVIAKIGDAGEAKSDGGGEKEEGGEAEGDGDEAEAEGGDEAEATAEDGDGEASEEEQESEAATAEGDGDEAEAKEDERRRRGGEGRRGRRRRAEPTTPRPRATPRTPRARTTATARPPLPRVRTLPRPAPTVAAVRRRRVPAPLRRRRLRPETATGV